MVQEIINICLEGPNGQDTNYYKNISIKFLIILILTWPLGPSAGLEGWTKYKSYYTFRPARIYIQTSKPVKLNLDWSPDQSNHKIGRTANLKNNLD